MNGFIIDDDRYYRDVISNELQLCSNVTHIYPFENLFEALESTVRADFIVIDISAVGYTMMGGAHQYYSPICSLADKHPGANIIIVSAMGKQFIDDVIELVKTVQPDTLIEFIDVFNISKQLRNRIEELV